MFSDRRARSFLEPHVLARLSAVPLFARRPMQGTVSGRHPSPHRGSSVEFAEYRKYVPGDDLRRLDPKFQPSRFAQYLTAVRQLDQLARDRFNRRVIHLAVRWMLDQGIGVALWGGRHPDQLHAALGVAGWSLDAATRAKIDRILSEAITDPIGPEFVAPLQRSSTETTEVTA